jgi:hypothetical protein
VCCMSFSKLSAEIISYVKVKVDVVVTYSLMKVKSEKHCTSLDGSLKTVKLMKKRSMIFTGLVYVVRSSAAFQCPACWMLCVLF